MRIEYDNDALDIIDKVNEDLRGHDLEFADDGKEHDGYAIFELKSTNPCTCTVTEDGMGIDMECPVHGKS